MDVYACVCRYLHIRPLIMYNSVEEDIVFQINLAPLLLYTSFLGMFFFYFWQLQGCGGEFFFQRMR